MDDLKENQPFPTSPDDPIVRRWMMCMSEAGFPKTSVRISSQRNAIPVPRADSVKELIASHKAATLVGWTDQSLCDYLTACTVLNPSDHLTAKVQDHLAS